MAVAVMVVETLELTVQKAEDNLNAAVVLLFCYNNRKVDEVCVRSTRFLVFMIKSGS